MFNLEQINEAKSKANSAADFPKFVKEIQQLGVIYFDTFVNDGHSIYYGEDYYSITSPPLYPALEMAQSSDDKQFLEYLKRHQDGKTSFETFCKDCAKSGIIKWVVNIPENTCTYYSISGTEVFTEEIPEVL